MNGKIQYDFLAEAWQHSPVGGGWYFVSLPLELSKEIREHLKWQEGWGRLKATAQIGATAWETAIWFDTKQDRYLLPLKAAIRKKENIEAGNTVKVSVRV